MINKIVPERLAQMRYMGMTYKEIGLYFGVSKQAAHRAYKHYLKRNKIFWKTRIAKQGVGSSVHEIRQELKEIARRIKTLDRTLQKIT